MLICRSCGLAGRASFSDEEEEPLIETGHSSVVFVVLVVVLLLLVRTDMQRLCTFFLLHKLDSCPTWAFATSASNHYRGSGRIVLHPA